MEDNFPYLSVGDGKNKRDFAAEGMGISSTNAIEADIAECISLDVEPREICRVAILLAELLGCLLVVSRAIAQKRDVGKRLSWSMLNMPSTRDLGVKVEEPVAPEFGFLPSFHPNELSIRWQSSLGWSTITSFSG